MGKDDHLQYDEDEKDVITEVEVCGYRNVVWLHQTDAKKEDIREVEIFHHHHITERLNTRDLFSNRPNAENNVVSHAQIYEAAQHYAIQNVFNVM